MMRPKDRVIDALVFTRNDLSAFCFRVDRQEIVNEVYSRINRRKNFRRKLYIYSKFDEIFLKCFRDELQELCARNGVELAKLGVECDADMEKTVKRWNMMPLDEGIAHEIADAVSWCNMHGVDLPGCLERDFVETIRKKLLAAVRR